MRTAERGRERSSWMVMTSEGRQLRDAVAVVLRDIDGLFLRLAQDVGGVIRQFRIGPLQTGDRVLVRRLIDRAFGPVFGFSRAAVRGSLLYRVIVANMEATSLGVFGSAVRQIEEIVTSGRGPDAWRRLRSRLMRGGDDPFGIMVRGVLDGPSLDRQRLLRSRLLDPERRWIDGSSRRLSDRVWRVGRQVRRDIDAHLRQGIREGRSAVDIADGLERFLTDTGRTARTRTPYGRSGNYASRRLARTEVARASGAATIEAAKATPGLLGVQWMLSASHAGRIDACDDNAGGSSAGLPRGVYLPAEVPRYPSHPNERCVLQRAMKSRSAVLDEIEATYGDDLEAVA